MKTGTFFVRTWRIMSILGLLFSLFNSYISYPGEVVVRFDALNQPLQMVDREIIFYVAVAIFLISNTLLNVMKRLFPKVPTAKLPLSPQSPWLAHRDQLNEVVVNWFYALMAAINTVLGLGLIVLSLLNRSDRPIQAIDYAWLAPLSTVIIISVLAALPIKLLMKPDSDGDA